jgi:hypothetical protein
MNLLCKWFGIFCDRPTFVQNICSGSGLLPNKPWCPETPRRYYKTPKPGEPTPPTATCAIHQAPPPPIEKARQTPPRIGLDSYHLYAWSKPQIKRYVEKLVKFKGSRLRIMLNDTWGMAPVEGWKNTVYKIVGQVTNVGFGGEPFPVFTIAASDQYGEPWNPAFVDKLGYLLALCKERDILLNVSIVCGLNYGADDKGRWEVRHHPWIMAYQHLGAESAQDTGEYTRLDGTIDHGLRIHTGGMYGGFSNDPGGKQKEYMGIYFRWIAGRIAASGAQYEISTNEVSRGQESYETPEQNDEIFGQFLAWFADNVKAAGVPNEKIIISAAGAHNMTKIMPSIFTAHPGIRVEWHLPNSPEGLRKMIAAAKAAGWWTPRIVRIDGDSQDPQALGHYSGWSTGPNVPQGTEMNTILVSEGIPDFNFFDNYGENKDPAWEDIEKAIAGDPGNPDNDPWNVLAALAGK